MKVGMIVICSNRLLLVQEEGFHQLPGGKMEGEEGQLDCLRREISEELPGSRIVSARHYHTVSGKHPTEQRNVLVATYIGELEGVTKAGDIQSFGWYSPTQITELKLTESTTLVVERLVLNGYLV